MPKHNEFPFAVYAYTAVDLMTYRHKTKKSARHQAKRLAGRDGIRRLLLVDHHGDQSLLWEA